MYMRRCSCGCRSHWVDADCPKWARQRRCGPWTAVMPACRMRQQAPMAVMAYTGPLYGSLGQMERNNVPRRRLRSIGARAVSRLGHAAARPSGSRVADRESPPPSGQALEP